MTFSNYFFFRFFLPKIKVLDILIQKQSILHALLKSETINGKTRSILKFIFQKLFDRSSKYLHTTSSTAVAATARAHCVLQKQEQ